MLRKTSATPTSLNSLSNLKLFFLQENKFIGQGGESGGPAFTTNNIDEFAVHSTLHSAGFLFHQQVTPQLYYSFQDIIETTKISNASCFDFPGVCPDIIDLTMSETNLQAVNAKIELILNENLNPRINRVYRSANQIIMEPGFEFEPVNTSLFANIEACPQ